MVHNNTLKSITLMVVALLIGTASFAQSDKSGVKQSPTAGQFAAQYQAALKQAQPYVKAPARTPSIEPEVIWDEDFSAFAGGSEDELGKEVTEGYWSGVPYIEPSYFNGEVGWWGMGVYEAGGKVALGMPGQGGALNTPSRELYGHLHVTFKVKVRDITHPDFKWLMLVSIAKGDIMQPSNPAPDENGGKNSPTKVLSFCNNDGWQDIALDFDCPYQGDDVFIQFNFALPTQTARYIIDDFKVTRDYDMAVWPTNLKAKNFSHDGFTASWTPGVENNSYQFSLLEEKQVGTEPCSFEENFDSVQSDTELTDWLFGGTGSAITNKGVDGTTALIVDGNDDVIVTPTNGGRITGFTCKIGGKVDGMSMAYINIEGYNGFTWENIGYYFGMEFTEEPIECDFSQFEDNETFQPVNLSKYNRLRFFAKEMQEGDYFVIDDVKWTTTPEAQWTLIYDKLGTHDTMVPLHGLDPDNAEYYFSVIGVKDGKFFSAPANWLHALGGAAPYTCDATDVDLEAGTYRANWEAAAKAVSYTVKNYTFTPVAGANDAEVILSENFDGIATDGKVLTQDDKELADFGAPQGWMNTNYGVFIDGALGICGSGNLYSPELTLNHNRGAFDVHIKARAYSGAKMGIQAGEEAQMIAFPSSSESGPSAQVETDLHFTSGKFGQRLMFYSLTTQAVMIDEITVTQKVNAGDKLYNLVEEQTLEGRDNVSCVFTGIKANENYAFTVTANGNCYGEKFSSDPSRPREVNMEAVGIEAVNTEATATQSVYFDLSGRRIAGNAKGLVIEMRDGKATKRMVK